jgi:hypothetical protein
VGVRTFTVTIPTYCACTLYLFLSLFVRYRRTQSLYEIEDREAIDSDFELYFHLVGTYCKVEMAQISAYVRPLTKIRLP